MQFQMMNLILVLGLTVMKLNLDIVLLSLAFFFYLRYLCFKLGYFLIVLGG
jgi:hypothetical protein